MAFENSNREYTFNALSCKANNRQGEMFVFPQSSFMYVWKVKWLSWQDRLLTVPLQPKAPCLSATIL